MKINKEGTTIILVSGAVISVVYALLHWLLLRDVVPSWLSVTIVVALLIMWGFIIAFFREPPRPVRENTAHRKASGR